MRETRETRQAVTTNGDLARRCHAITKAGEPCPTSPLNGTDYCLAHSSLEVRESLGFIAKNGKQGRPRLPKATELMRERLEEQREEIIRVYWDAMNATLKDGEPDHQIRLQALRDLLDRVYGKPTTKTELTGDLTLDLSNLAARAVEPYEETG